MYDVTETGTVLCLQAEWKSVYSEEADSYVISLHDQAPYKLLLVSPASHCCIVFHGFLQGTLLFFLYQSLLCQCFMTP
jgi:hypothetical protein